MKVLFLDVDGVLNSLTWFAEQDKCSPCSVDPKAVRRVLRVCEKTGAVIVLSSSWRHVPELVDQLKATGLPIVDKTPSIDHVPRWKEIDTWLGEHLEVDVFAIIDDDADAGMVGHVPPCFVRTHAKHGMYGKHEKRLIEILGESRGDTPAPNT